MAKSAKRTAQLAKKNSRKEAVMKGGGTSKYARKSQYLGAKGLYGFQVPEPKPWGKKD
jgi:hypothetical protein